MAADDSLENFNISIINYWALIPAALIILFLSFLERRKNRHDCCDGRPALLIPFRFLDGYDNRTAYAMAFGTTTSTVVSLITSQQTLEFETPLWTRALYVYLQAFIGCLTCFPLFACLTTRYRAVGALLCILYSSLWLSLEIVSVVKSVEESENATVLGLQVPPGNTFALNVARAFEVLQGLPIVFCYVVLIGYCIYILQKCFRSRNYFSKVVEGSVKPYQEDHVRWVLRKFKVKPTSNLSPKTVNILNDVSSNERFLRRMRASIRLRFFTNFPFFKYPAKIFALAFVLINVLYWTGLLLIMITIRIMYELFHDTMVLKDQGENDIDLVIIILVSATLSLIASILNTLIQIFVSIRRYRYHMLRLYQGDRSFTKVKESSQYTLTSSMTFPGYQVGFMLWGLLVSFIIVLAILLIITIPIYFGANAGILDNIASQLAQLLSFPATMLILFYLQVFMSKHVLLQDKLKPTDEHPPLNVDNRKFFEIVNYYSLFTNMAVGILTCLWRILESAFFGIFSVGRLDRSVFTRDLEHLDRGYKSYISMLEVDNAHNNPSMRVFAHLLWTKILAKRYKKSRPCSMADTASLLDDNPESRRYFALGSRSPRIVENPSSPGSPGNPWTFCEINVVKTSQRSCTRWHLAYTLVNNPHLCKLRKHKLADGDDDLILCESEPALLDASLS